MAIETNFRRLEPASMSRNAALSHALVVKMDEFYTHYDDVAKEMDRHALQFAGKAILCNCDDPFESAFFRYFLLNFRRLGLSRLISTCYAGSPISKRRRSRIRSSGAYTAVITDVPDGPLVKAGGSLDLRTLLARPANSFSDLTGNGDFRSDEAVALLRGADIVATNPPFSLFRDYMNLLVQHGKNFIILGNLNAATYREVFPLFRDNLLWYGESIRSGDRQFYVPDSYPLHAANCGIDDAGRRFIRVKGVRWFTNLDTQRRHETIDLTCRYTPQHYPKYENYDAIEVGRTQSIPADYDGIMGVPITFLDKYNPDQFDIVMLANGNARTNVHPTMLKEAGYRPHPEDRGGVGIIDGRRVYARILIRRAAP